jgi:homoserine kinase type II
MAVFTAITPDVLQVWLDHYPVGRIVDLQGIASGIENTNYFLTTEAQGLRTTHVLTVFERLSFEQLPYYLNLMQHLAQKGIPVPAPLPGHDGQILRSLAGKPATLVSKLPGQSQLTPQASHCAEVGEMLAKMHLAGQDYSLKQANLRSLNWWETTMPHILPYVDQSIADLLHSELKFQQAFFASTEYAALPKGPCHCDLFRDNALFDQKDGKDVLGGFFDFYFAGHDAWLFDIAVTVNDWCIDLQTGELDQNKTQHFLNAYQKVRALTDFEKNAWPAMLRAAAMRFWVSRLWDFYLPRDAQMLKPHDPRHFERVLNARIHNPIHCFA